MTGGRHNCRSGGGSLAANQIQRCWLRRRSPLGRPSRRSVFVFIAVLCSLSACGSDKRHTDASPTSRGHSAAAAEADYEPMPLDVFLGNGSPEEVRRKVAQVDRSRQELTAVCMQKAGLQYLPIDFSGVAP